MTRQTPRISVLTCCYNAEDFVEEAIESILHQSYREFEYVLVDDGSMDNTLSILKRYAAKDKRIVLIEKEHSGLTTSLNVGLEQAKGEWIARLDADDIAMPERLSNQLNFVQENKEVVLLGGCCQQINQDGICLKINRYPSEHDELINALENNQAFFPHSSACFRRDTVMRLGGYRERFPRAQDYDLWLRLSFVGKLSCCQDVILQLRKHSENISNLNSGYVQQLRAMAAATCHFRKKAGLSDVSQMEEEIWQDFLKWVEKKMEEKGEFQCRQGWQALRDAWYSTPDRGKIKRVELFLKELMQNPLARKAFWGRFAKENLAMKLAKESREIW